MAHVLYLPFSDVEPRPTAPGDYQRIPTTPREFGAGVAEGEQRLGAGATHAAQFFGQVAADQSTNNWQTEVTNLLHGDPKVPGDVGVYGLEGQAAMDAVPKAIQKMGELRKQYAGQLATPDQQLLFDQNTRRMQNYLTGELGRHYDSQAKVWAEGQSNAAKNLATNWISNHAADPEQANHGMADLLEAERKRLARSGVTNPEDPAFQSAMLNTKRGGREAQIRALMPTNPSLAQQLLDENRSLFSGTPGYDALSNAVQAHAFRNNVHRAVAEALGAGGGAMQMAQPSRGGPQADLQADFAKSHPEIFGTPEAAGQQITTVSSPSGASFQVHDIVAPQIRGFLNELEGAGYKINPETSGGYNKRMKVGVDTHEWSEHAFGTAIDINPEKNPQSDKLVTDLPENIGDIAARWGLKWGGTFEGKKDAMHFEVAKLLPGGQPEQAIAALLPRDQMAKPGPPTADDPRGMIPVIRAAATAYGHNPDVAVQVAKAEGLTDRLGDGGKSGGAFQLFTDGGLGNQFRQQTGLDPLKPENEPASIYWAMQNLQRTGWEPYRGAAAVGVQPRQGINTTMRMRQAATDLGVQGGLVPSGGVSPAYRSSGLTAALDHIESMNLTPEEKEATAKDVERRYRDQQVEQDRFEAAQRRATKEASDQRANQIVTDMAGPNPAITVNDVRADPHLEWQTKEHLIAAMATHPGSDPAAAAMAYGPGFWDAYRGVVADPGDPNRIIDMNAILRRAGPGGDLSLAGAKELGGIFEKVHKPNKPEALGEEKVRAGALAYAKHHLSLEADYGVYKVRDPDGEDRFNIGFTPAFFKYWQDGIAAGKSPQELTDKLALDKLIEPFKRSPQEEMAARLAAGVEDQGQPATPKGAMPSQAELEKMGPQALAAAVREHPALRSQAETIAVRQGWIRATPAPPIAGAP